MSMRTALWLVLLLLSQPVAGQIIATQGDHLAADVSRTDGRIAMDLFGSIWLLPPAGGAALKLIDTVLPARRPRWSPDGLQILYQTTGIDTSQLWLAEVATGRSIQLGQPEERYQQAAWHPDGERIIFSSWRRNSGLDIWELDLHTGMEWRLSDKPGDETEAAWSADGRHLAYIHHEGNTWTLVLRRFGEPDTDLIVSDTPLASPSWRPDGTLITFLKKSAHGYALQMAILSEPVLERELGGSEDYFLAPVSWLDRNHLYYTADGRIKTRGFGEWRSRRINFRATIGKPDPRPGFTIAEHDLPLLTPPSGKLVIRSSRLFDGLARGYRDSMDVLLDGGIIAAVVPRQDWPEITVLDVGSATLLPGFIDAYSALPDGPPTRSGAELLAYGVTTLVSTAASTQEFEMWDDEQYPGPRILRAANLAALTPQEVEEPIYLIAVTAEARGDPEQREQVQLWQERGTPVLAENRVVGRSIGASLLLAANTMPPSPLGNRYQDRQGPPIGDPLALLSGLAGEGTPGLAALYRSRQASRYRGQVLTRRRLTSMPKIDVGLSSIVLASKPNGMPPGLALHAELRALSAAGLSGDQVLKAAGRNAARILGLGGKIGQITPGARADLILVSGDPLINVADALNIIAVVRNGRFFSLVSLLERAQMTESVE
ncbi:MAG: PD40 domain-containing protein [Proteobacteria bacterium]|nr:PD40 domain-containing protein [Pseudomonadota bacterium]